MRTTRRTPPSLGDRPFDRRACSSAAAQDRSHFGAPGRVPRGSHSLREPRWPGTSSKLTAAPYPAGSCGGVRLTVSNDIQSAGERRQDAKAPPLTARRRGWDVRSLDAAIDLLPIEDDSWRDVSFHASSSAGATAMGRCASISGGARAGVFLCPMLLAQGNSRRPPPADSLNHSQSDSATPDSFRLG